MLVETLAHWQKYDFGPVWKEVMTWIAAEGVNAPERTYQAGGCDIFVSHPSTRPLADCRYETHRVMVDVQMVLKGGEYFYQVDADNLPLAESFDETRDLGFHAMPAHEHCRVHLCPGLFALVFPWDAHMPLADLDNKSAVIKKLVAKIPLNRLQLAARHQ